MTAPTTTTFDPKLYDPDTFVQELYIWGNLMCPRRSTHCLIRPGAAAHNLYLRLYS